uniref:Rho GTPase-activating protein SYDE1 n=1 Tax=Anas platyrhynchos platyrhynchos TaxID=8840 RepID=A0A493TJ12_ANAPP
ARREGGDGSQSFPGAGGGRRAGSGLQHPLARPGAPRRGAPRAGGGGRSSQRLRGARWSQQEPGARRLPAEPGAEQPALGPVLGEGTGAGRGWWRRGRGRGRWGRQRGRDLVQPHPRGRGPPEGERGGRPLGGQRGGGEPRGPRRGGAGGWQDAGLCKDAHPLREPGDGAVPPVPPRQPRCHQEGPLAQQSEVPGDRAPPLHEDEEAAGAAEEAEPAQPPAAGPGGGHLALRRPQGVQQRHQPLPPRHQRGLAAPRQGGQQGRLLERRRLPGAAGQNRGARGAGGWGERAGRGRVPALQLRGAAPGRAAHLRAGQRPPLRRAGPEAAASRSPGGFLRAAGGRGQPGPHGSAALQGGFPRPQPHLQPGAGGRPAPQGHRLLLGPLLLPQPPLLPRHRRPAPHLPRCAAGAGGDGLGWGGGSRHGSPPTAPLCSPGCRAQQLAVRLQPRGVLFSKFTLVEQWDGPGECEPRVFGVELGQLVERENSATKVPLLIQKCVSEIEKRGLKVVGLYRLCGSAAVKKELRDAFERDSAAVTLSEQLYPDINVITGILKDYLRELPTPLITPTLYHVVLEAMAKRPPRTPPGERDAVTLLDCLPDVEKATLTRLLDHLSLVASFHDFNRMNPQNIAVCFGPVLLTQSQEPRRGGTGGARSYAHSEDIASAVDFKRHIEVLHYLLQAWPAPRSSLAPQICEEEAPPGRPRQPALHLELLDTAVVARHRPRGPESPPSNRYAGDWSVCSHQFGGYDEVVAAAAAGDGESRAAHRRTLFVADFGLGDEPEAPFGPRLNLKDFDALILDLERELAKQINVCL